jgi:hypothetical protein
MTEAKFASLCRGAAKDAPAASQVGPKILSALAHIIQMGAASTSSTSSSISSVAPATPTNGALSPSSSNEVTKFTRVGYSH